MLNIIIAGIGGQGAVAAGKVIMHGYMRRGLMVKRSEIHGMAQRGGSVVVHVRIGKVVYSPTIPDGEVHYLLALDEKEGAQQRPMLSPEGCYLTLLEAEKASLLHKQAGNIALLAKFFSELKRGASLDKAPLDKTPSDKNLLGKNARRSLSHSALAPYALSATEVSKALKEVLPPLAYEINLRVFQDYYTAV